MLPPKKVWIGWIKKKILRVLVSLQKKWVNLRSHLKILKDRKQVIYREYEKGNDAFLETIVSQLISYTLITRKKTLSNIQEIRICYSLNLGNKEVKIEEHTWRTHKEKKKKSRRCFYGTLKKHNIQITRTVMIPVSTTQIKPKAALNLQESGSI